MTPPGRDNRVWWVALGATLLAIVHTWPLAAGLTSDVPGDLGDSLLNMWILAWGAEHLPRVLTGQESWHAFWNAGIFHPEPYTLALSEHMTAQALQVAPLYAATGNIILGYNLLFLSTFVLSAVGAYLLARDLTGDWRAGMIAALVYGFLPYRIPQIPHLQVLSSQWMPFVLWGLHRFIAHRSTRGLVGGTAALVVQNWSCGYYLLYFAPFVPLFAVQQLWQHQRLRDARAWMGLAASAVVTLLLTVPFLLPYLEVQRLHGLQRPYGEVLTYSANVWAYATTAESLHLWGRVLRMYPRGEGEAFLGTAAIVLALVALAYAWLDARRGAIDAPAVTGWRRWAVLALTAVFAAQVAGLLAAVFTGGIHLSIAGLTIRASSPVRLSMQAAMALAGMWLLSARTRATLARLATTPSIAFAAFMVLAAWLSLGPSPSAGPWPVPGLGLYGLLYEYVPGFTGVRVPARYAMIAGLFLSLVAAFGTARLLQWRAGVPLAVLAGVLVLADSAAMPLTINHSWSVTEATPPDRVFPVDQAPYIYRRLRALPPDAVVAEFPFGDGAWEIRYMFYAPAHGRRILNGYSGAFPTGYTRRVAALRRFDIDSQTAWAALTDAGATHAVVHHQAFASPSRAAALETWLASRGARLLDRLDGGDALWELTRP